HSLSNGSKQGVVFDVCEGFWGFLFLEAEVPPAIDECLSKLLSPFATPSVSGRSALAVPIDNPTPGSPAYKTQRLTFHGSILDSVRLVGLNQLQE
ncbi:MAG: hypothetical protein M1830_007529, partial [Pleopsidium flavum]